MRTIMTATSALGLGLLLLSACPSDMCPPPQPGMDYGPCDEGTCLTFGALCIEEKEGSFCRPPAVNCPGATDICGEPMEGFSQGACSYTCGANPFCPPGLVCAAIGVCVWPNDEDDASP